MTATKLRPADVFMNLIVSFLTPMFLATTGGDLDLARTAAIETVNAYTARDQTDLLPIAQMIAFGLAVLSSISLSMEDNLPIPLILRLRGNAASLHRAAEHCRRSLQAPKVTASPLSEIEHQEEDAMIAEVARTQQRAAECKASFHPTPTPPTPTPPTPTPDDDLPPSIKAALDAMAADSQRRTDKAEAALNTPAPCSASRPMTEDEHRRLTWSNAMANVAREFTADIASLSPSERRAATIRAAALTGVANELLAGVTPSPVPAPPPHAP